MEFLQRGFGGILTDILIAVVIVIVGWLVAQWVSSRVGRSARAALDDHTGMMLQKIVKYAILVLVAILALAQLGVSLGVLIGAAGVLSVAIGFAAQASISNIISGFFLMAERPFSVGDVIKIAEMVGKVKSIDLMALHIVTPDNLLIRIPNETVLKSSITNVTAHETRRVEIPVGVSYGADLERAKSILLEVAGRSEVTLDDPAPVVLFTGFGASSQDLLLCAHAPTAEYFNAVESLTKMIKESFDREGIEIPFNQMVIHNAPGS